MTQTFYVGNEKIEVDNSTTEEEIFNFKSLKENEQKKIADDKKTEFAKLTESEKIIKIAEKLGLQ